MFGTHVYNFTWKSPQQRVGGAHDPFASDEKLGSERLLQNHQNV